MQPNEIYIAARDIAALQQIGQVRVVKECAVTVIRNPYTPSGKQWLVDAGLDIGKEVWVNPSYEEDYRNFWILETGILRAGNHVDHIYGRARAMQQGYGYVRLALLPGRINTSWARWEAMRTKIETRRSTGRELPPLRPLDYLDAKKLEQEVTWREFKKDLVDEI